MLRGQHSHQIIIMMHCFSEYEKKYLIITFTAVFPNKVAKCQLRDYLSLNKYKEQYSVH